MSVKHIKDATAIENGVI